MNSEKVLSFFKEITAIPRESGHEEHIIAYLQDFAAKNGLECKTDEAGNVKVYASTYIADGDKYNLSAIETDKEWKVIETILNELQANLKPKNSENQE